MNHLFPPYVSQTCQRYMARWCVANRGIPFGSRATRSENIRDDYDKPVRLYFNFDDDHPETFDREEFERVFVGLFPGLYPVHLHPHGEPNIPVNFDAMARPLSTEEKAAYESIENARFDRLQAEFTARHNKGKGTDR
jgi:hypothetical protein